MQQKNTILFFVLAMGILFGWLWLEPKIWPPRLRLTDAAAKQAARDAAPFALFNTIPEMPGAAAAVQVSNLLALSAAEPKQLAEYAAFKAKPQPPAVKESPTELWAKIPFPAPPVAVGNPVLAVVTELALLNPERRKSGLEAAQRWERERQFAGTTTERVTIGEEKEGGEKYHLRVRLTTKGAGVESLILNRFQKADSEGRHVYLTDADGKKRPAPMELIQEDPYQASFLMFLYPPEVAGKAPRPYDTLGMQQWQLVKTNGQAVAVNNGVQQVVFRTTLPDYPDVVVRKTYTLAPRQYHLGLTLELERLPSSEKRETVTIRYQFAGGHGTPVEGEWFTTAYRNSMIGQVDGSNGLWRHLQDSRIIDTRSGGNRIPESENRGDTFIQYAGVSLQYFGVHLVVDDQQAPRVEGGVGMKEIVDYARPTLESTQFRGHIVTIDKKEPAWRLVVRFDEKGVTADREFTLLPRVRDKVEAKNFREGDAVVVSYYQWDRGRRYATDIHHGQAVKGYLDDITVRVTSQPVELRPGAKVVHKYLLYNGPVKVQLLSQFSGDGAVEPADLVDRYANTLHLRTLTDYPSNSVGQWTGLSNLVIWITGWMHWLLEKLHYVLPSYGLDIILLTLIVRGIMFPITRKSVMSMNKLQALQPEMKKIQEKYKNDAQARSQAMMELYRKHNVSPVGGCLPLFLQMPIFFGLYFCLQESIHFRLAPFLWINNLAAPDMLLRWGEGIPWISDPDSQGGFLYLGPYFNILPILAVALMVVQQKLLMPPPADEQQAMQHKMMMWMSIVIGVLFYKVAAGLCIYFIVSSIWGMTERKLLPKKQTPGTVPPAGAAVKSPKGPPPRAGKGPKGKSGKRQGKSREPEGTMDKVKGWWNEVLKQAKKK